MIQRMETTENILNGLKNNEFKMYLQFIVDNKTKKIVLAGICEGVETEEQNTLVSQSDCDYIHGWYYAKAMPVDECENFVESYNMSY
jgi:EAL domain-containing protein (putative c-di-GMP-specific phosphodiesterase class I)